ncbi:MAG: substrate-binding domain-containing protein [Pseudomonadota bacterium]|nr:substrate-binding domain-containing protein [Pseudomonadota bacterium]
MVGKYIASFLIAGMMAGCSSPNAAEAEERAQIRAVGSSTVFPFTRAVAEQFHRKYPQYKAPSLESTGTGAGMRLFCGGVGFAHPDLESASRRITPAELDQCRANGVAKVIELEIGLDGLAFAQSPAAPVIDLSAKQIYEALAANPYGRPNRTQRWSEIDPGFPDIPILVYGPPATSGTRDALADLLMIAGCDSDPAMRALKTSNENRHRAVCTTVRTDGRYVDSGEDDDRVTQQVIVNPGAIGIFGYSYLDKNRDKMRGVAIGGIAPTEAAIVSGRYPGARPLYLYLKGEHVGMVPGLKEFVAEYVAATGPDTYLAKIGLIPAPQPIRDRVLRAANGLAPLAPAALH